MPSVMPPTRGHDLKLVFLGRAAENDQMPPTRGHDLKHLGQHTDSSVDDAPHTGARLETQVRI